MSITRINEFQAADGKAADLFTFLKSLKTYISSSPGCESCEVLQSNDNDSLFVVIEVWDSADSHKASLDNYPQEDMAAAMPLIGAPPKGGFYHS
ncbi:putative quinol monooxygenase [Litoribrevibacter euphylliae]|uniref:Quinol monooxygenase n=1 Tax=Litoribrevibacter euphylliae TaxID=1834034 RepID=A0ABV7HHL9_9GAMM